MYLVHPEHPPADPKRTASATAIRPSGGSLSERRMDHFPGGAPTFQRCTLRVRRESIRHYATKFLPIRAGAANATDGCVEGLGARFVYILRSKSDPDRHYVGRTSNVDERLAWHNDGPCGYTTRHRPWSIIVSIECPEGSGAARFERYLKTGSGRAFARRHFGGA